MKKVITYGTYDLLHQGHINLLRRAKELGDYLIVGVTSDSFDRERGKLNVRNNVLERIEAVRQTGYADEIVIEDYVGQKIDDIQRFGVDIFAIGSDWQGHFDYLKELPIAGIDTLVASSSYSNGKEITAIDKKQRELPFLVSFQNVSSNYFTYNSLQLKYGNQEITAPDEVIVSRSFARKAFGEENPIGQVIRGRTGLLPGQPHQPAGLAASGAAGC